MSPDSINEIIAHFAGYFRVADDVVRDRLEYLEGAHPQQFEDYTLSLTTTPFRANLEPFWTLPSPPPALPTWETSHLSPPPLVRARQPNPSPESEDDHEPAAPRSVVPTAGGGGGGGGSRDIEVITVKYDHNGSQQQVEIRQVNVIQDNDVLLVNPNTGVTELNDADTENMLRDMADAAADAVPDEIELPQGVMEVAEFIEARDAEASENSGSGNDPSVAPGIYVNGELQNPDYTVPFPELSPPDDTGPPANTRGQIAELGSNTAINGGLLVDRHEASPTMIVLGDFFATNAIVQTWSYTDNDQVSVGGSAMNAAATGDNSANNVAHFDYRPSVYPDLDGYFSEWTWDVHVVQGDFYDINLLVQEIYLSDNDVTVQETQQSLFEVHTGDNQQFNLAELFGGDFNYDLIIIGGDYHGGNYIFQHAFLVDDDVVMMSSTDGEPPQTIGTGGNALLNNATIQTYGSTFVPLSEDAQSLVTALQNGETALDPSTHGLVAPSVGTGPLNVLYITGDYYDINAIWQYITVADADTALQLLSGDQALQGGGSGLIQSVQTGGNTLLNDAAIADIGPGTAQVGGEVYSDTVLVQAQLVSDDNDTIINDNTDALVNELIAFIGPEDDQDANTAPLLAPVQTEDPIGGVLA
jgi:hypothetical protein